MKNKKLFKWLVGAITMILMGFSVTSNAQVVARFPDGRVVYKDGTIVYPNGEVKYPDGRVVYPNTGNTNNGQWLPPGQAKKRYGKNGKHYAPRQNRNDDNDRDDDNRNYNNNRKNNKHHGNKHDDD